MSMLEGTKNMIPDFDNSKSGIFLILIVLELSYLSDMFIIKKIKDFI
jgi:hypothetical protein